MQHILHEFRENAGRFRRKKSHFGRSGRALMGIRQIGYNHGLATGDVLRNRQSPGFHTRREHQTSRTCISGKQFFTAHKSMELDGLAFFEPSPKPAGITVLRPPDGKKEFELSPAHPFFQQDGRPAKRFKVFVAVGRGRKKELGQSGRLDGIRDGRKGECRRGDNDFLRGETD